MIDFAAQALVLGGALVATGLGIFMLLAALGEALATVREARETTAEAETRQALYPAPDVEARGTVIEVTSLLDRLRPLDPPSRGVVGGDGFRHR